MDKNYNAALFNKLINKNYTFFFGQTAADKTNIALGDDSQKFWHTRLKRE